MKSNPMQSPWGIKKSYLATYLINCFGRHLTNKHTHLLGIFILLQIGGAEMESSEGSREVMAVPGCKYNPA